MMVFKWWGNIKGVLALEVGVGIEMGVDEQGMRGREKV